MSVCFAVGFSSNKLGVTKIKNFGNQFFLYSKIPCRAASDQTLHTISPGMAVKDFTNTQNYVKCSYHGVL